MSKGGYTMRASKRALGSMTSAGRLVTQPHYGTNVITLLRWPPAQLSIWATRSQRGPVRRFAHGLCIRAPGAAAESGGDVRVMEPTVGTTAARGC